MERHEAKRAEDMDITGHLFGVRFVEVGRDSTPAVELYIEDDGFYHFTCSFSPLWLTDLEMVTVRAKQAVMEREEKTI